MDADTYEGRYFLRRNEALHGRLQVERRKILPIVEVEQRIGPLLSVIPRGEQDAEADLALQMRRRDTGFYSGQGIQAYEVF
jgi:hypothetical protein